MTPKHYSRTAAVLGLCAVTASYAADNPTPADASADNELEELVITAERTSENLQKVPIAASVQTGADLETHNITDITGLQFDTPGLSVTTGSANITFVNIRGVGYSASGPALSAGVANYRDGLFVSQAPFLIDPLYDVQQVEVLRGPQGTLSGQNSTGGAVLVTSRKPTFDGLNGYLTAQYGSYDDKLVEGAINLPVNDWLGTRLAFNYEGRDSFFSNVGDGTDVAVVSHPGNLVREDVRLSILATPIEPLEILLRLEEDIMNSDGQPMKPIPGSYWSSYAPLQPYVLNYNVMAGENDVQTSRVNLQLTYHVLPWLDAHSQTGYQASELRIADDEDGTNQNGQYSTQNIIDHQWTEELNLTTNGSGPLQGVVGTYFFYDTLPSKLYSVSNVGFLAGPPFDGLVTLFDGINKEQSEAVFGQGTLNLGSHFQVVGGVRYTFDRKVNTGTIFLGPVPVSLAGDYRRDATTGKAAINWSIDDQNLLYVQASRGFKAGGINTATSTFNPEFVWNYELGFKTSLFDSHVRAQLDAYYMNYNNFQISQVSATGGPPTVVNSAGADIKGLEGQVQVRLAGLGVDATAAYTDSRFKPTTVFDTDTLPFSGLIPSFLLPLAPTFYSDNQINIGGHPLDYAPKFTGNLGVEYAIALGAQRLTPRAQVSYVASQWGEPYDTPVYDYLPSHTTLDLRLTWEPDDLWRVALYSTNVTNQVYLTGKEFRFATEFYGAPLQYGVRVSRSFK